MFFENTVFAKDMPKTIYINPKQKTLQVFVIINGVKISEPDMAIVITFEFRNAN